MASGCAVADEIRSDLADAYYVCVVDEEVLATTPRWSNLESDPPLSLPNAIRIAAAKVEQVRKNDTAIDWQLSSVRLERANRGAWYYVSTFRSKLKPNPSTVTRLNSYKSPRELHVPVLMNGRTPDMVEHRYSKELLKLLDDLKL
ncbi:MAG: hypothetical protein AAGA03_16525 [Planctomycetota bacterium]